MNKAEIIFKKVLENKVLPLEQIIKELEISREFIFGIVESNQNLRIKGDYILIKGLGEDRCIICSEIIPDLFKDQLKFQSTMHIRIDPEMINGYKFDPLFRSTIKGHKKCYSNIDLFFRVGGSYDGLTCFVCSSWAGEYVAPGEVSEECKEMTVGYSDFGNVGIIGKNSICNYYSPNRGMETHPDLEKARIYWKEVQPKIKQRELE